MLISVRRASSRQRLPHAALDRKEVEPPAAEIGELDLGSCVVAPCRHSPDRDSRRQSRLGEAALVLGHLGHQRPPAFFDRVVAHLPVLPARPARWTGRQRAFEHEGRRARTPHGVDERMSSAIAATVIEIGKAGVKKKSCRIEERTPEPPDAARTRGRSSSGRRTTSARRRRAARSAVRPTRSSSIVVLVARTWG